MDLNRVVDLKKTKFAIISAVANNNVIGLNGQMPWNKFSEDLKRFKSMTENHVLIMGQKTFESLGKPLPKRINVVISNDWNFNSPEGYPDDKGTEVIVVRDIQSALNCAEYYNDNEYEIFVIGGGTIYRELMKYCYRLYITRIFKDYEGDTFFPEIEPWNWKMVWSDKHQGEEFEYEYQIWDINYD